VRLARLARWWVRLARWWVRLRAGGVRAVRVVGHFAAKSGCFIPGPGFFCSINRRFFGKCSTIFRAFVLGTFLLLICVSFFYWKIQNSRIHSHRNMSLL